jgi:mRNA interferase MazF
VGRLEGLRPRRGDVVTAILSRELGKARPCVVVQSDQLSSPRSILVCPLTSELVDAPLYRLDLSPDPRNGLRTASQVMIDKTTSAPIERVGPVIGRLSPRDVEKLDQALAFALGLSHA